ncbi:type I-E CRISPR-associated protein Cse2/CasB [Rhodococcus sp. WAY2]|uniref:type I-E CRISPR-associated protein Cse2/CasB n=1 Tax=Rhodococcus sp. WAY2 TaxID=2663121 RepID=UPI00131FFB28|nr:type I-E CRISPR-associated protein Cse2/CasB [Rhodococcus sp. WAY2]QHE72600.1 hypothetical protein GFS60_06243 [Rhodococcus sp. WAY2]
MHSPRDHKLGNRVAHRAKRLSALRRWEYPTVDRAVIAVTEGADEDDYLLYALAGKAFTIWHSGRSDVHYGKTGTGLGRAMRQLGRAGAYGPRDPRAERALATLLDADTPHRLAAALDSVMAAVSGVDHPPHWETLISDLRDWHNPTRRDQVRLRWGQQFYTAPPKPTEPTD